MMSHFEATLQQRGSAGFAICETEALAGRIQALLAELREMVGDRLADPGDVHRFGAHELDRLGALSDEVVELAAQMAHRLTGLPLEPLTVRERDIAEAARAALAEGIADDRRAIATARLLRADQGFPALAEALIESDAHLHWDVRVVDAVGAFRDVDETRARQVAALAGVPDTALFGELPPERILELAYTLRQLAGR